MIEPVVDEKQSTGLGELFKALALAHMKIKSPGFDKEAKIPMKKGGSFKFKYCSLGNIQNALREPLSEQGLVVMQFPSSNGNKVSVETVIGHSSGQFISRTAVITAASTDVKDIGGAITYQKRYSLAAIFNLTADEDMDATAVSATYVGNPDQKKWLNDKLQEAGVTKDDMVAFHNKMIDGKLPASDQSIFALLEDERP